MDQWGKRLILFFFVFYLIIGSFFYFYTGVVASNQDFDFHFKRLNGLDDGREYSPLYHLLFLPFGFNPLVFYAVNILFICVIIPILIYGIARTHWSILAYFCGVALPHMWVYSSTFPHMITFVLLLVYFNYRKNVKVFFVCAVLASFMHSRGLELFLVIGFLEIFCFYFKKMVFRAPAVGFLMYDSLNSIPKLIMIPLIYITIPVLVYGLKKIEAFYALLIPFSFFLATIDFRGITLAQLVLVLSCGPNLKELDDKTKNMILVLFLFMFCYYVGEFVMGSWKMIIFN